MQQVDYAAGDGFAVDSVATAGAARTSLALIRYGLVLAECCPTATASILPTARGNWLQGADRNRSCRRSAGGRYGSPRSVGEAFSAHGHPCRCLWSDGSPGSA